MRFLRTNLIALLVLLVALTCVGQAHFRNATIRLGSSGNPPPAQSPEQLASYGLAHRWVALDLPTNTAINNWTDRIQGSIYTVGPGGSTTTNSLNNGVWIDVSHYFSNNWQSFYDCVAFGFILKVITPIPGGAIYPAILYNATPVDGGNSCGLEFHQDHGQLTTQAGNSFYDLSPRPFPWTNALYDLIVAKSTNDIGSGYCVSCTNGVFYTNGSYFAWLSTTNYRPYLLGHNRPRNSGPNMWLQEFWIWTNSFGTNAGFQSILTNFHIYKTNAYPGSP